LFVQNKIQTNFNKKKVICMNTNQIVNVSIFATLILVVGVIGYTQGKAIREDLKKNWGI
jgi:hypothetical protein